VKVASSFFRLLGRQLDQHRTRIRTVSWRDPGAFDLRDSQAFVTGQALESCFRQRLVMSGRLTVGRLAVAAESERQQGIMGFSRRAAV
jgi:hypothetical protein